MCNCEPLCRHMLHCNAFVDLQAINQDIPRFVSIQKARSDIHYCITYYRIRRPMLIFIPVLTFCLFKV